MVRVKPLSPDAEGGGLRVTLRGDFGTILERAGKGDKGEATDTPRS